MLTVLAWWPSHGVAAARHSCAERGSKVLIASGTTRIYRVRLHGHDGTRVRACRPHASTLGLGYHGEGQGQSTIDEVERPTATGHLVAYGLFNMDYDKLTFEILVRDINTGETLTDVPTGTHQPTYPSDMSTGIGPTTAIALRRDGAVAWIVANTTTGGPGPLHYEVWAARGSNATQIATGTDIDPTTLSINATAVTWSLAGQPASAQPAQIQNP